LLQSGMPAMLGFGGFLNDLALFNNSSNFYTCLRYKVNYNSMGKSSVADPDPSYRLEGH
jgi:hypothetical protein